MFENISYLHIVLHYIYRVLACWHIIIIIYTETIGHRHGSVSGVLFTLGLLWNMCLHIHIYLTHMLHHPFYNTTQLDKCYINTYLKYVSIHLQMGLPYVVLNLSSLSLLSISGCCTVLQVFVLSTLSFYVCWYLAGCLACLWQVVSFVLLC